MLVDLRRVMDSVLYLTEIYPTPGPDLGGALGEVPPPLAKTYVLKIKSMLSIIATEES